MLGRRATRAARNSARLELLRARFSRGDFDRPPLSGPAYDAWRELTEANRPSPEAAPPFGEEPLISVLMPVYNPLAEYLRDALDSLINQTWGGWECCIADDCSTLPHVRPILEDAARRDRRFRVIFRKENGHICAASNAALAIARGAWCALLDDDDILAPEALAEMARAAAECPEAEAFFSDEDQIRRDAPDGELRYDNPLFKPGCDPDLLLGCNSINHFGMYRTSTLRKLQGFRIGYEGAQDHDLALRVLEEAGMARIRHIPQVLYHWRRHSGSTSGNWEIKPYAREASLRARQEHAERTGMRVIFETRPQSMYTGLRFIPPSPLPALTLCVLLNLREIAEEPGVLDRVRTALERAAYDKRETFLVCGGALPDVQDNDPADTPAAARSGCERSVYRQLERLCADFPCRLLNGPHGDMFSLANLAAAHAHGKALLFLRAGDVPLVPDFVPRLIGALWRTDVAVVSCRGVLSSGCIAQAGYAVGYDQEGAEGEGKAFACPACMGLALHSGGYFHWAHLTRSVPGVYLSGMCCRRELFKRLGGFRQHADCPADLDFCLRAWRERGLRSVIVSGADLEYREMPRPMPLSAGVARAGIPFQNPHLAWTPGGWKLRPPRRLS